MIDIVLDVVRGAAGGALALVNLVGPVSTHVTVDVQLMIANRASAVTAATEFLVVRYGALSTLASHQVRTLRHP